LNQRSLRRLALSVLTGPPGRLTAFVLDIAVAASGYWAKRLLGRR